MKKPIIPCGAILLLAALCSNENLPPSDEASKSALEKSPRHGEYEDVKVPGSDVPIRTWVVYPERKDKAPVVMVIHEGYGFADWIRGGLISWRKTDSLPLHPI